MTISRRSLFRKGTAALGIAGFAGLKGLCQDRQKDPFAELKSMTGGVQKLTAEDYQARQEKARRLMNEQKVDLLYLNPHFSPDFYCGGGSGHVCCVALHRAPRRTVEYACGALRRAPCIHARLRRLATKPGEKCGLTAASRWSISEGSAGI